MAALAFYRGRRTLVDRVICSVTRSEFSHVEFLPDGPAGRAISSSGRDGGVRWADIDFGSGRWDVVCVPWAPPAALERIEGQIGARYDFPGLIGSQFLNLRRQSAARWFCSEICAYALGMSAPHRYSPGDLYIAVVERNAVYQMGIEACMNTRQS